MELNGTLEELQALATKVGVGYRDLDRDALRLKLYNEAR